MYNKTKLFIELKRYYFSIIQFGRCNNSDKQKISFL